MRKIFPYIIGLLIVGGLIWQDMPSGSNNEAISVAPVDPNWAQIAAWPSVEATVVEATPNPNRRITAIVLDDSGSMENDISAAKQAVVAALEPMEASDRVAVIGLNSGVILPFGTVSDARAQVETALRPVPANGGTPLTGAVQQAEALLAQEAANARGFGTYRMIITTDGVADDGQALAAAVEEIAANTPIQIATIGIDLGGRHVLARSDLASFVDVANVAALGAALQEAVAENTAFDAVTTFEGGN